VSEPSLLALALDLVEPEQGAARPTVEEALRSAATGSVTPARSGDAPVALVVLDDGRAYTVPDACPHDGNPLSDGFVDGESLVCSRHGWEVDVCSGRCPARPRVRLHARRVS
jgi:nitrite reductase/ring-hydroxylating ferredoxin subunit